MSNGNEPSQADLVEKMPPVQMVITIGALSIGRGILANAKKP